MANISSSVREAVAVFRRPLSAHADRAGHRDMWLEFDLDPEKSSRTLRQIGERFGNVHECFEQLSNASDVRFVIARFQVVRGVSKYLKMFSIFYDPKASSATSASGDRSSSRVSGNLVGVREAVFAVFGCSLTYSAFGISELRVELFTDRVFGFGRVASIGDSDGNDNPNRPSVRAIARDTQVIERFAGGRRRHQHATTTPATTHSAPTNESTSNTPVHHEYVQYVADPTVTTQLFRPARINMIRPIETEFFGTLGSDHVVLIIDASVPMAVPMRRKGRPDLMPRLQMVVPEIMKVSSLMERYNSRCLVDLFWVVGDAYGSWQLDADSWGEVARDKASLFEYVRSLETHMNPKRIEEAKGRDNFSNAGFVAAIQAAMSKVDAASIHVVVDGSHAFDRSVVTGVNKMLTRVGTDRRCPPVHITVAQTPGVEVARLTQSQSSSGGGGRGRSGSTSIVHGEKTAFLRNICTLTGGSFSEVGGFEDPTWYDKASARWAGSVARLSEVVADLLPSWLKRR